MKPLAPLAPTVLTAAFALCAAGARPASAQPWTAFDQQLVPPEEDGTGFGSALTVGDFDNDGWEDLAVGEPDAQPAGGSSGRVSVYFGSPDGIEPTPERLFETETGSEFGFALAVGDFDNDSNDELVVGIPGKTVGDAAAGGEIRVYEWGEDGGLVEIRRFTQDSSGVLGSAESSDRFGAALAVGDFDDDGIDDLAIGVPGEDVSTTSSAGAVNVLFGDMGDGLTSADNQLLYQGNEGVIETSEAGDEFGFALAAGDFSCDGQDDLAIGFPGEEVLDEEDAGRVMILRGGEGGLDPTLPTDLIGANTFGTASDLDDRFGAVLATGRFSPQVEDCDDLLIGVPGDADEGAEGAGAVGWWSPGTNVATFLTGEHVGGGSLEGDAMGRAIALGDFDGDGVDELAIGVPERDSLSGDDVGRVLVLDAEVNLGDSATMLFCGSGVRACPNQEEFDEFGAALASGDFDGDGLDDLAIGIPDRVVGANGNAGKVAVFYSALFAADFEGIGLGEWSPD